MSQPPNFGFFTLAIAACWLAAAYKLPALLRHPHDRAVQAFCGTLLLMGLAAAVLVEPARGFADRVSGVHNFAQLLGDSLGVASGCTGLILLSSLNFPAEQARPQTWRYALVAAITVAALAVLFLTGPAKVETEDFWIDISRTPSLMTFRLIFLAYIGFVLTNVAWLTVRYAAVSNRPSMRVGLYSVALGGLAGDLWVLLEAVRVVAPAGAVFRAIDASLMVITVTFIGIGSTLPSWGPRLGSDQALYWLRDYRSLQRLYPLWRWAWRHSPEVMLVPPRSRIIELIDPRDVRFRLYRRLVEIRDAMLVLNAAGQAPVMEARPGRADFVAEVRALEQLARNRPQIGA